MQKKLLHIHPKTTFHREMRKAVITIILIWFSQSLFAQSVGINTNNPDPSASLEVAGTNKGLLIPRISLQSLTDKATIPNPATALLVYNTNAGLGKVGFYYNSGSANSPAWSLLGAGAATLTLPFSQVGTNSGPLFLVNNNDGNSGSIAISGLAINAIGVRGATANGTGIVGNTSSTGKGVLASAANINGTALEVNGRMQIHGPGQTIGAGRVLTSDANGYATWENAGNGVAFSANGIKGSGSDVLASNGTLSKVAFANEVYDFQGDYIDINGAPHSSFVVPISGIYHFDAKVTFSYPFVTDGEFTDFKSQIQLIRTRNGVPSSLAVDENHFNRIRATSSISIDVPLLPGDIVHISAGISGKDNNSGSLLLQPNTAYFNGRLVLKQ